MPSLVSDLVGDLYSVLTGKPVTEDDALTYDALKRKFVRQTAQHPIDTMVATTLACSALLYAVEREHNPKLRTPADALWAVSSCIAAVSDAGGAVTPLGKALLGWVMAIGPGVQALVAAEGMTQRQTPPPASALDQVVVRRLEHIAQVLEQILEHRLATQPVDTEAETP